MKILLTDSRLLSHPDLQDTIKEMMDEGHTIDVKDELGDYSFIAGPNCWYLIPEVGKLFRGALDVRRKSENQTGAIKSTTQAAAERKSPKRSRSRGKDTNARTKKGQPSPYS